MKNIAKLHLSIFIFFLLICINTSGQKNIKIQENSKSNSFLMDVFDSIKISKWKYDYQSCINFSFDDNVLSQSKISKIFDEYGFKSTYFVNPINMYVDSLKDISARGHEIGSHTYSHIGLGGIDSLEIDFRHFLEGQ